MAQWGFHPPFTDPNGYGYPEINIQMKLDIYTDTPEGGINFSQVINTGGADGVPYVHQVDQNQQQAIDWNHNNHSPQSNSTSNPERKKSSRRDENGRRKHKKHHESSTSLASRKSSARSRSGSERGTRRHHRHSEDERGTKGRDRLGVLQDEADQSPSLSPREQDTSFETEPPNYNQASGASSKYPPGAVPVFPSGSIPTPAPRANRSAASNQKYFVQEPEPPKSPPLFTPDYSRIQKKKQENKLAIEEIIINTFDDPSDNNTDEQTNNRSQQNASILKYRTPKVSFPATPTPTQSEVQFATDLVSERAITPILETKTVDVQKTESLSIITDPTLFSRDWIKEKLSPAQRGLIPNSGPVEITTVETTVTTETSVEEFARPPSRENIPQPAPRPLAIEPVKLIKKSIETLIDDPGIPEPLPRRREAPRVSPVAAPRVSPVTASRASPASSNRPMTLNYETTIDDSQLIRGFTNASKPIQDARPNGSSIFESIKNQLTQQQFNSNNQPQSLDNLENSIPKHTGPIHVKSVKPPPPVFAKPKVPPPPPPPPPPPDYYSEPNILQHDSSTVSHQSASSHRSTSRHYAAHQPDPSNFNYNGGPGDEIFYDLPPPPSFDSPAGQLAPSNVEAAMAPHYLSASSENIIGLYTSSPHRLNSSSESNEGGSATPTHFAQVDQINSNDNSIDDERSDVSGHILRPTLGRHGIYTIYEASEDKSVASRTSVASSVQSYPSGVGMTLIDTPPNKVDSQDYQVPSAFNRKSLENALLKKAQSQQNIGIPVVQVQVAGSRSSIDSETSSISGRMVSGMFIGSKSNRALSPANWSGSEKSAYEERLSDYLSGNQMMLIDEPGSPSSTLSRNESVISETSLTADRCNPFFAESNEQQQRQQSSKQLPTLNSSKERSFAEILKDAHKKPTAGVRHGGSNVSVASVASYAEAKQDSLPRYATVVDATNGSIAADQHGNANLALRVPQLHNNVAAASSTKPVRMNRRETDEMFNRRPNQFAGAPTDL